MLHSLIIRYRFFVFIAVLIIALSSWGALWVSRQKQQAVEEFKQEIKQATTEQIKKDEITVIEAFKPNAAIESVVDGMLSDSAKAADGDSGLLSARESAETDGGSEAGLDSVLQPALSDSEIDSIQRFSHLLQ